MSFNLRMCAAVVVALAAPAPGPAQVADPGAPARSTATRPASDSALEARTSAVAATLRCPVCQGESIQDSPSALALEMRALVREQLRAGRTPEEIKAYFVERYGEWILLEPKMRGLNVLLYAFPVAIVLGGLALVAVLVRKWSAPGAGAG